MRWLLTLLKASRNTKLLQQTLNLRKHDHRIFPLVLGFFSGFTISSKFIKDMNVNGLKMIPVAIAQEKDNILHEKRTKTMNFIADAVEIAAPAVVHIEVEAGHHSRFGTAISSGSGFIVNEDGMILTNAHVVNNSSKVKVRLSSNEILDALVIDVDEETDLAAVKIMNADVKKFPNLTLGSSSNVRAGEWVAALGSPLRLSNTVTAGIVSCLHRASGDLGLRKDNVYIQTDAPINVGNSGGPLINLDGEVIGINCITVQQATGISFAIPSDVASEFLEGAINKEKRGDNKDGFFSRGRGRRDQKFYIGISMLTLSPPIVRELQQRNPSLFSSITGGVLVARVNPSSPSERSGLQIRDVIVSINNKPIKSSSDVYKEVRKGESMVVKVQRSGQFITLNIDPEITSRL